MGVETLLAVEYVFPSTVASAVALMALTPAEISRVSVEKASAPGLNIWLSEPSFIATPTWPIPS